jgi:hypothetical protein
MSQRSASPQHSTGSRTLPPSRSNGQAAAFEDKPMPGQPPEKTEVLNTWCHALDLLQLNSHRFVLRDTQHVNDAARVTTVYLDRHELEALGRKIQVVLTGGMGGA